MILYMPTGKKCGKKTSFTIVISLRTTYPIWSFFSFLRCQIRVRYFNNIDIVFCQMVVIIIYIYQNRRFWDFWILNWWTFVCWPGFLNVLDKNLKLVERGGIIIVKKQFNLCYILYATNNARFVTFLYLKIKTPCVTYLFAKK